MRANKYKEIRPLLQSGDIVLFRGRGVISGLILLFCRLFSRFKKVQFSHIGMIVVDAGRVMLFESTTLYGGKGVQLKPLSEVLQIYKGGVFVRRLICERDERFYEILFKSVTELLGRPYEKNIIELMGAAAGIVQVFDGHKSNLSSVFCSELVSEILKREGFLSQSIPPNEYSPDEYDVDGKVDEELYFSEKEVRLGKVLRIK